MVSERARMAIGENATPSLMTRVAAKVKGEVRADTLDAYRRAGGVVYGEMQNAEALRGKLADGGGNLRQGAAEIRRKAATSR